VRILGIDPGSVTTGFGVIDYDRGRLAILNRVRLQSASCGCYSQVAPEVEHGT